MIKFMLISGAVLLVSFVIFITMAFYVINDIAKEEEDLC